MTTNNAHIALWTDADGNRCLTRPVKALSKEQCIPCSIRGVASGCNFWVVEKEPFEAALAVVEGDLLSHPDFDTLCSGEPSGVGVQYIEPSPNEEG